MVASLRKIACSPRPGGSWSAVKRGRHANYAHTPPPPPLSGSRQSCTDGVVFVRSKFGCCPFIYAVWTISLDQKGVDHYCGLQMVELRTLQQHLQQPVLSLCVLPFTVRTEQQNCAEVATYPCCYYGTHDDKPLPASPIPSRNSSNNLPSGISSHPGSTICSVKQNTASTVPYHVHVLAFSDGFFSVTRPIRRMLGAKKRTALFRPTPLPAAGGCAHVQDRGLPRPSPPPNRNKLFPCVPQPVRTFRRRRVSQRQRVRVGHREGGNPWVETTVNAYVNGYTDGFTDGDVAWAVFRCCHGSREARGGGNRV